MAKNPIGNLMDCLRESILAGSKSDRTDGQLLEDYVSRRDETAMAVLVRRQAPMVWGVCRRVLQNHHDAEDAFQASFLVLVRKATSIVPREMVGNWLHGVAHQTALKARSVAAKRKQRERQVVEMPEPAAAELDTWRDLQPILDKELSRLPDKYRVAIVLCDLQGKTRKEAARQLKIPEGTLSTRLRTARTMLAKRLARHGLAMSGGALATVLSHNAASACVPASVVSSTIHATTLVAAGQAAAIGAISVQVAALTDGVVKTMLLTKLKTAMAVLLVAVAVVGSGSLFYRTQAAQPGRQSEQPATPALGAEQNTQAEKKPKEDKNPKSLKAAVNKALADVARAKDELTVAEIQLRSLIERYERLKEAYEKETAKQQEQGKTKSVWTLDFRFKELRLVAVDGQLQGRKTVWYCWYFVSNPTDEAHTFIPDFELVAGGQVYHDTVLPGVQEAVRRIEDPTQFFDLKNSVTISNKPIPPSKNAADEKKSVVGLALWEGIDPDARSMTLFVSGLSNDWFFDGKIARRKTLKLSFKRVDKKMRLTGPPEWVYRAIELHKEDNKDDQQTEIELKTGTQDWRVLQMDRKGEMAYVNLGSSDGLTPKVTFSIRNRSQDGKPNPAKGTLEIVRVIGPHLSQARVTSVKNSQTDPIHKGDQLFNPTRNLGKRIEEMPEKAKDKKRGEIEKTKQAIAAAEKRGKDWQKQREHLQAVLNELERKVQSGDTADLNRRIELELLNKRLKTLGAYHTPKDKP